MYIHIVIRHGAITQELAIRTISELFREAFRAYRAQRVRALLEMTQAEGRRRKHHGHAPEDVERLIHEVRTERGPRR